MENASKALLIAGGVLLLILVLSFATFLIGKIGAQTSEFYKEMDETEIYQFNQKFFNYEGNNLNIQDVVSVINLAKDANERGKAPVIIEVKLNGSILDLENVNVGEMLSDDLKNSKTEYSCSVDYADNSDFIGKIEINKK